LPGDKSWEMFGATTKPYAASNKILKDKLNKTDTIIHVYEADLL
jgi:hypothetical protein